MLQVTLGVIYSKPITRDDNLKSLVDSIGQQNTGTGMAHHIICAATNRMLIGVGTMLMENRAKVLLPICSDFNQHAKDLTAAQGIQELSSGWILSEITAKYQHHVTYESIVLWYTDLLLTYSLFLAKQCGS